MTSAFPIDPKFIAEARNRFAEQGFVVLEHVLDAGELAQAQLALDSLGLPHHGDHRPILGTDPLFLDLMAHPVVFPWVLALMGANVQVASACITTIPPDATPMVWHEDGPRPWSYPDVNGVRPLNLLRAGFFMEDLRGENRGNLAVLPGSHRQPPPTRARQEALDGAEEVQTLQVPAGGVVLFHNALWHATRPNHMDVNRRVIYYAYTPSWHRTVDYVSPPQHLLNQIATMPPARQPLLRQLVGATPAQGATGFFFTDVEDYPAMDFIAPDEPASGA